jgi:hypothetical protein
MRSARPRRAKAHLRAQSLLCGNYADSTDEMRHGRGVLPGALGAILGLVLMSAPLVRAQAPAQTPSLEPPRLATLPPIVLAPGMEAPPAGRVEVVVQVAADGRAMVEQCDAGEAICALVRQSMTAARFEPALRNGMPIAARLRLALELAESPAQAPSAPTTLVAPAPVVSPAQVAANSDAEPGFGARARINPQQPGMRRLELAEMRDLPGAFGDPFRAVDSLPGVVPVLSGLPYFFIRGAPPAGTLYIYDDIPVPTLYHLAVGPAVIHPRMVGPIRLYSGVAPARYGRLTGGTIVGEGPEQPDGQTHAEAELRLLDVSGYVQSQGLGGSVTAAVRYGYPALLLSVFSPTVSLAYWDYQLRYAHALSAHDHVELVALGSYDSLGFSDRPTDNAKIAFHRLEPRLIRRVNRTELGIALLLGWDESTLGSEFRLQSTRIGSRAWLEQRFDDTTKLRLSADMTGVAGFFASTPSNMNMNDSTARNNLVGDVPARSMWGVQAELGLRPWPALELQLGGRADAWVQGAGAEAVIDPRLRVIVHASSEVELHVAGGVVHQPAVFYLPLPGIVDVATDRGLQTAIQSEAGVGWDTPLNLRAELQFFLHHYSNLVFTDALLLADSFDMICKTIQCGNASVPNRIDGFSYGAEVFIKRPVTNRLSGWISYTLAWSAVDAVAGLPYTPTWDVRHIGNLVLQWNMGGGFSSGARLQARSGKLQGAFVIDDALQLARDERRLPGFARLDLELAYAWRTSWGRLRVSLEWFNATLAREPAELICTGSPRVCQTVYLPAIFFPNLGVRGEI